MSHNIESAASEPEVRMFPALRVLERQTPPLKYGRPPYWRAPVAPPSREVYVPTWNWFSPLEFPEGASVTVFDVNAAYMAAMGSVKIGHSHLVRTGRLPDQPDPRKVAPGYYKITVPYWAFGASIVHPLGDAARVQTEPALWITAPTLILLLEIQEQLGGFEILDSWTAEVTTDFRSWSDRLRSIRGECLDRIDMAPTPTMARQETARYESFKTGYSSALSMMLTGQKCLTLRPDWAHTVYAQHAASTWRKAWRWTFTGRPLVSMGAVDEIAVLSEDVPAILRLPKPPFRFDPTGRQIGAFKAKKVTFVGCQPAQRADTVAMIDESEDVL